MTMFVISDTHFGHGNIIEVGKRKFENAEHMNHVIIEKWNKVVKADDTVFHLGDFGWKNTEQNMDILSKLKGEMVFICGNHDTSKTLKAFHTLGVQLQDYLEVPGPAMGKRICLFHYPMQEWNGFYNGAMHCHGHTHSSIYSDLPGRYNVCVEAIGYAPKPLKDVEREHYDLIDLIKETETSNASHIHH